jgi:hypothetical protein
MRDRERVTASGPPSARRVKSQAPYHPAPPVWYNPGEDGRRVPGSVVDE